MVPCRWVDVRTAHAVGRPSVAQGVKFTDNVVADPDLSHAVQGATLLIFVLPHQVACTAPLPRANTPPDPAAPPAALDAAPAPCFPPPLALHIPWYPARQHRLLLQQVC